MQLAIFFDAAPVAGDAELLQALRHYLDRVLAGGDAFLARFAAVADAFEEHHSLWARLTSRVDEQPLDLKKLGTFPIVHGVRALCLQNGVREPGTAQRVRRLVRLGVLDADLGRDMVEALHFLMELKLRHQLRQSGAGELPGNLVQPSALSTMDRDQLKDALAITRRFLAVLRQRFHLDAL
jgi:CBS domain-containing protein